MKAPEQNQMLLSIACMVGLSLSSSNSYAPLGGRCDQENDYYEGHLHICCSKCPPGQYALQRCTRQSDTLCAVCREGEFTEFWNYVRECQICPSCDHRRGLVVRQNCTSQHKTECECAQGHHCVEGQRCSECERHTECPPGQEEAQQGSNLVDTTCRECPPGTFRNNISLDKCQKHTNCTTYQLIELQPGSSKSDAVCGDPPRKLITTLANDHSSKTSDSPSNTPTLLVIGASALSLCCFVLVVGLLFYIQSRRSCGVYVSGSKANTGNQNSADGDGDGDGASLESKLPLLDSGTGPSGCRHPQSPPPDRLDTKRLSQTPAGRLQRETDVPVKQTAHTAWSSASGGQGPPAQASPAHAAQGQPGPEADAEARTRPQEQRALGGQPAGVYGAHGLVGLQDCHVQSFESNLTVNGPLYIYNGQPFPSPNPPAPEGQREAWGSGVGPGWTPWNEEEESGPHPTPEETPGGGACPVQESVGSPGLGPQASGLVQGRQEEGKESHGPSQEGLTAGPGETWSGPV